jgi:hypothetical protein
LSYTMSIGDCGRNPYQTWNSVMWVDDEAYPIVCTLNVRYHGMSLGGCNYVVYPLNKWISIIPYCMHTKCKISWHALGWL